MTNRRLDTDKMVRVYPDEFYPLHNFSAFTVTDDVGRTFPTAEHCYQFIKFAPWVGGMGAPDVASAIRYAKSAHDAFQLAQQHSAKRRDDWDQLKLVMMDRVLRWKFAQHEYVRRKLQETGTREIVEDSWRDSYWGRDVDAGGTGENWLGRLWMIIRRDEFGLTWR